MTWRLSENSPAVVQVLASIGLVLGPAGCNTAVSSKPVSVLLVTVDTLRADHVGAYGGDVATPHLDAVAGQGTAFLDAVVHSPLTLPSHSSILTGTYPTYHGVRDNGRFRLPDEIDTLAEMLKRRGFKTAAFVGAYPVHSRFGLSQGFDHYDDAFERAPSTLAFTERPAGDVVSAARAWITDAQPQPYFVWVHVFDPHAPYAPPEPFRSRFEDPYDGEVAYVDDALGELLSAAGDDVLTVVTADHGEGLGEHGEDTHSLFIYDSTMKVPLILRGPGVPRGSVIRRSVRSIDVLPSILDLLAEDPGACTACQGESLVDVMVSEDQGAPRASYGETYFPRLNLGWSELRSIRHGGWKYIAAPEPELYHLAADPKELTNLVKQRPDKVRELASELTALEEATTGTISNRAEATPDPETLAALRSLGYVSARTPPSSDGSLPDPKGRLPLWQALHQGMDRIAQGEFGRAIEVLQSLLEKDASVLMARSYLGAAYLERGRYSEAAAQFGQVLSRDPDDGEATFQLGRSLFRLGRLDAARKTLRRAAELDPHSPDPLAELATLHLQERQWKRAKELFERARARDATSPAVLVVEGKLLALEGRGREAEAVFRRAVAAAPFNEEPRVQLANLLLSQRRLGEAAALAREGLSRRPESALLRMSLGHSLALEGKMTEAIEVFESALELAPQSTLILNSLGFAYLEAEQPRKGIPLLRRSLAIDPDQPELLQLFEPSGSR